jgi:hypothetical protein
MISNLVIVSLSLYWFGGDPVVSSDDGEFHVLDFYPDEEKVDFAYDDVFQMIPVGS